MSGPEYRAICRQNLPGIIENLRRLYSEADDEVQEFILRAHNLGLASMRATDPAGMRAPLYTLLNLIGAYQPLFILDPEKFEVLLLARAYASIAMGIVDLLPAVPAQPAGRVQQAQPQLQPARRVSRRLTDLRARVKAEPRDASEPPAVVPQKRRRTLPARFSPARKAAHNDDNVEIVETKKCRYCQELVVDDEVDWLRHAWDKHKEHVYKYIRRDLVCTADYCDFVSTRKASSKIHAWHCHDNNNPKHQQHGALPELEAGKCTYCDEQIDSLVDLKQHTVNDCKKRDERPMLSCSSCPKTFHFICDVIAHLRTAKTHGYPILLSGN